MEYLLDKFVRRFTTPGVRLMCLKLLQQITMTICKQSKTFNEHFCNFSFFQTLISCSPDNRCPLAKPHIERGSLPPLPMSTHQRVHRNSEMTVIRSRAAFAERCPRPKSYRPLLRRHRSSHVQRSTADIPAHDFVLGPATHWSHTTPACRHRSSPRT